VRNLSPANWHIECLATKLSSLGQNNFKKHSISVSKRLNISIEPLSLLSKPFLHQYWKKIIVVIYGSFQNAKIFIYFAISLFNFKTILN
jgi:hypothetical protein